MESESGTNNTKISDSGYSHSGSNTTSQGSASSKSKHSGGSNSSRSSGYGGAAKTNESDNTSEHKDQEHTDQEHKKKNQNVLPTSALPCTATAETVLTEPATAKSTMGVEIALSPLIISESLGAEINNVEPLLANFVPDAQIDKETFVSQCEDKLPQTWTEKNPVEKMSENEFDEELLTPDPIPSNQPEVNDGFCCVISMDDGVVLYTTPSLTSVLGFTEDMWLGQSFIDFVHPKDRETFSSQVNISIALPLVDSQGKVRDVKNYLYACLKKHANMKSPSELNVEIPIYQAFHLTVTIKQITDSSETNLNDHNNGLFLLIIAVPVYSAYKVPRERKRLTKFGMRHTATCILSYVDHDVVTNFGFLPQDMLGKSVFDFYHPEDMPFLKEVYKSVIKTCHNNGSVFRSKPYRFLVQNGCFVLIETEWSCVVNPWSRRLEFVISLHQVLQGPLNPNVFDVTSDKEYKMISQEVINQGKALQAEIIKSLTEELPRSAQLEKREVSKRSKDLANFVESILNTSKMEIEAPQEFSTTTLKRDSIMLGEISPHHDLGDSKSSSETPPSYNQLNYNENLNRFFQSNPKTTMTSDESNSASNTGDIDGKNSRYCLPCAPTKQKCLSPLQNSRASGSGSAGNLSSSSNPNLESITTSGTNTPNDDYKPSHLTESLLTRHNEDMERIMIQKHKEDRSHKDRQIKRSHQVHEKRANEMLTGDDTNTHNQGVKRSGSWEENCFKLSKLNHQSRDNHINEDRARSNNLSSQRITTNPSAQNPPNNNEYRGNNTFQTGNNFHSWPPFSVAVASSSQNSIPLGLPQNVQYTPTMLPVYYVSTLVHPRPDVSTNLEPSQKYQVQYVPANLLCNYNPVYIPQPILCSAVPMVPVSIHQNTVTTRNQDGLHFNPKINSGSSGPMDSQTSGNGLRSQSDQHQFGISAPSGSRPLPPCDRPSSQATSIKAEPGSTMDSIASASVVNKALSECSRKDLGLRSVCSPDTPLVSPPDGETQAEQFNTTAKVVDVMQQPKQPTNSYRTNCMDEESSCYSSSYSSLLKTDNGFGSNDDSTCNSTTNRTDDEMIKQHRKSYPLRKKDPPWMESVSASSDLIYRYQIAVKDLEEVLKMDRDTLKKTQQPMMVNDQLHQLYIEMELDGLSKALKLEECYSSSSSSSSDDDSPVRMHNSDLLNNPNKKKKSYSSLMMIYEEDAPLPPPETLS